MTSVVMDVVAIVIAVAVFAILVALIEGSIAYQRSRRFGLLVSALVFV